MTSYLVTAYILIWPVIALGVLAVLSLGVYRDLRSAHESGNDIV